jgi:hypothetical protein
MIEGRYGSNFLPELTELIERFAPTASRFLEWGSGESTRALCDIAQKRRDPIVLSIDDHDAYQRSIAASLPLYPFLHFRCLDLKGPSKSQDDQYPSYSSYPFLIGLEFDFALIDGRRRGECALAAAQVISEEGVILVHDWRRSRYRIFRALFDTIFEGEQFLVLRPRAGAFERRSASLDKGRRVVVVPAMGRRAKTELAITLPFTEAYARRIGADCVVVGEGSNLPPHRIKSEAFDVAKTYDRALVIDADVLIRPHSPDVFAMVPDDALGAFAESMFLPREDACAELNALYELQGRLAPDEYFNSGVMVFSQKNVKLLEAAKDETMWGHPNYEQGFFNAKRILLGISLFKLSPDFNYMQNWTGFALDWRFAFFIHFAGCGRSKPLYRELWQDIVGDRKTFSRRPVRAADLRVGLIQQVAEQIRGRLVHILDPTDFCYETGFVRPIFDSTGLAIAYFFPRNLETDDRPVVWGPYITLDKGHWRGQFLTQSGGVLVYRDASLDVVKNNGADFILSRIQWPADGAFAFVAPEKTDNVEFRIYRSAVSAEFSYLRLERI